MHRFRKQGITLIELSFVLSIISILAAIVVLNYSDYRSKSYDAVTKGDLRSAYCAALVYFLDFPAGKVTLTDLEKYGFRASPKVNIRVINGQLSNLLMVAFYDASGTQAYMTYSREATPPGTFTQIWLASIQGWGTGAEQLAGQSLTNLMGFEPQENIQAVQADLLQVCNQRAMEELQEAYGVAQNYFQKNPDGTLTKDTLLAYGYTPDENVNVTINGDTSSEFSISSSFNIPGAESYTTNDQGRTNSSVARH